MTQTLSKSILLLICTMIVICGIYPGVLWLIGQKFFPFQANGSLLTDPSGKLIGSKLIAQPFTHDEHFQPRPSAASYDASASSSSSLAASNYALRDRVGRLLGPLVKYQYGPKKNERVGPDIETWFVRDIFASQHHIVAQWATLHPALATAWVNADPSHGAFVDEWMKTHPLIVKKFIQENPSSPNPKAQDLAIEFFQSFSAENPGKFPIAIPPTALAKAPQKLIPANTGADIQSIFFDMWRQDHAGAPLQEVPGDYVTASGSGLDPHITLQNAVFQLNRVSAKWATHLNRRPEEMQNEIRKILEKKSMAPLNGLLGEKLVNVLEINLELHRRYGEISG
ncbi:MAG: potassium-transporting ATPase subunit C [Candidatus Berkiellales bacterium]